MKWIFNKCRRCEASLSLLAADALAEAGRNEVQAHLATCAVCRAKFAELHALTTSLTQAGQHLPQVEAPFSLRRRWMTAVRESSPACYPASTPLLPSWLSGRRLAWGSLAAMWTLVLFFRFSAPEVPRTASLAAAPPVSLRAVLLALKVDDRDGRSRADAAGPDAKRESQPETMPPRSQRLNLGPKNREVA